MDKVSGPAMQIHPNYMLNIGQEKIFGIPSISCIGVCLEHGRIRIINFSKPTDNNIVSEPAEILRCGGWVEATCLEPLIFFLIPQL